MARRITVHGTVMQDTVGMPPGGHITERPIRARSACATATVLGGGCPDIVRVALFDQSEELLEIGFKDPRHSQPVNAAP
jgi:hypothetical protein